MSPLAGGGVKTGRTMVLIFCEACRGAARRRPVATIVDSTIGAIIKYRVPRAIVGDLGGTSRRYMVLEQEHNMVPETGFIAIALGCVKHGTIDVASPTGHGAAVWASVAKYRDTGKGQRVALPPVASSETTEYPSGSRAQRSGPK